MVALDLVVGGQSELAVRARHQLLRRWRTDRPPLPPSDRCRPRGRHVPGRSRPVSLDLSVGPGPVQVLLDRAASSAAWSPKVVPGRTDLSAAAVAGAAAGLAGAGPGTPSRPGRAAQARESAASIRHGGHRIAALGDVDGPDRARNHQRLVDAAADEATLAASLAHLEAARNQLDTSLDQVSRFAEPGALRLFGTLELAGATMFRKRVRPSDHATRSSSRRACRGARRYGGPADNGRRRDAQVAELRWRAQRRVGRSRPAGAPADRQAAGHDAAAGGRRGAAAVLAGWADVRNGSAGRCVRRPGSAAYLPSRSVVRDRRRDG